MSLTPSLPLAEARKRFFDGDALPEGCVPASILHSWRRCLGLGLPLIGRGGERLTATALAERREANADWLHLARPQIDTLFESVVDEGLVVIVADRQGVILDEIGHPAFLDKAERVALTPGMDWSETQRGTNAIGTALLADQPTRVRGGEHYLERNRLLSCHASPIRDPFGQVIGVLDVSGPPRKLGAPQAAGVEAAARLIEQRLFAQAAGHARTLLFHSDPAQLATPRAARLAFDEAERLLAADRLALATLRLGWDALGRVTFGELFGETLAHWQARADVHRALLAHGERLFSARLLSPRPPSPSPSRPATIAPPVRLTQVEPSPLDAGGLPSELLTTAGKLLQADIPVLILGETGTGKDQFARALHARSSRRGAPFVAVNCAAIPEGLIEAELFGYEEGAFTGARRQGSRGRLREAHGGVLFLDEIGDMPHAMQARLLRVLQDRVVMPLGGGSAHPIDIRLVCATHRDLRAMVQAGAFRADLYYRLCHFPLCLPPLRERGDVARVAQRILDEAGAATRGITLSPELASAIRRYRWPGNLRELANLLQTLLALVDDGSVLTLAHLPVTLREEMSAARAETPQAGAVASLLAQFGGNASAAARALGISRSTLYRKLRQGAETGDPSSTRRPR
ncbi:sigma-54-dependent Fis family transcriptional regulator [Paludibacterium purpuratum]|uniref:Transcriptional regulator of acetoin/glycerol metabolism n=1 Tax=Paludibacterium purpuratum TaxID=1144873 RepID=A0A4V3DUD1_9NEIS|nr:sigma-54-dependent Fis family transcriptional regulator [Paludibacterium purpuratum]TDR71090.1 transcriptional regulator of acetoin/glycerol metabolism [Paludibacterium purpuratum]